jgi:peptidyl-tRNA hydrolase, PTH2 family
VLKAVNAAQLDDIVSRARAANLPVQVVCDAGRTQVAAGTLTCCAIGPAEADRIDLVTADLPLL